MNNKIFTGVLFVALAVGIAFMILPKKDTAVPQQPVPATQNTEVEKTASFYVPFTQGAYEKALADGRIIFLDFYADWCPICRAEAPEIQAGFDSLQSDNVAGFRVNFKDNNTDEDEKKLAEEFTVPYQHTKIILKDGKEVLRSGDQWDKETFLKEINTVVQ